MAGTGTLAKMKRIRPTKSRRDEDAVHKTAGPTTIGKTP